HVRAGDAEIVDHAAVDQQLARQRRREARVEEGRVPAAGAVTLRAVRVEEAARTILERRGDVADLAGLEEPGDRRLVQGRREHPEVIPCAELVVGAAGGRVREVAVDLMRARAEGAPRGGRMTLHALAARREGPGLLASPSALLLDRVVGR